MGVFSKHDDDDLYMGFVDDGGPIPSVPADEQLARDRRELAEKTAALKLLSLVRKRLAMEVFLGRYKAPSDDAGYVACTPRFLRKLRAAMGAETEVPRSVKGCGAWILRDLLAGDGYHRLAKDRWGRPETDVHMKSARALAEWASPENRWRPEAELRGAIARLQAELGDA